ncbi:MAG TPA: response regulator [Clostridia bacterium]|nr:response regulator [Clostridia bacterium]
MKRALIVDDEELSRKLITALIEQSKLPIEIVGYAASGDEALDSIERLKPDIIYLDIEMPGYNGIEVMKKVQDSYSGAIEFIVITAYGQFEYAQASLRLGAKDILLKPIDSKKFVETMQRVIGYRYTDNQVLNEILEYISINYHMNIELAECAKLHYTTSNQVAKMFKKHFDTNFSTYVNDMKIGKAKEFLKETDLTIQEISCMVGYNNLNYFYRKFKGSTGVTPSTYRKNSN